MLFKILTFTLSLSQNPISNIPFLLCSNLTGLVSLFVCFAHMRHRLHFADGKHVNHSVVIQSCGCFYKQPTKPRVKVLLQVLF